MAVEPELTAAILAGGASSRMGRHKALLENDGQTFLAALASHLAAISSRTLVAGEPEPGLYAGLTLELVHDSVHQLGPLGGVLSALQACRTPYLFVCPCDTPSDPSRLALSLLSLLKQKKVDIVFCEQGGKAHPLFAVMKRSVVSSLQRYLESGGRKVLDWMQSQKHLCYSVNDDSFSFININTPGQYAEWVADVQRGSGKSEETDS